MTGQADTTGRRTLRRRAMEWLIALVVVYAVWCGILFISQDRFIFPRKLAGPELAETLIPAGVERVWIEEGGARVEAWFIRAPRASGDSPAPAVLFTHGNGELIDHCLAMAERYGRLGMSVLLPEYRGYGRSTGEPSERAITADMVRFFDWLAARPDVDTSRIVFHGRSLGTGVVAQLAKVRTPAAMVLESPFTSVASFAWHMGAPPALVRSPFRNDRVLPGLGVPLLILHSVDDEIIGIEHGRRLHALVAGSELVELGGTHNSGISEQPEYWDPIERFLEAAGVKTQGTLK